MKLLVDDARAAEIAKRYGNSSKTVVDLLRDRAAMLAEIAELRKLLAQRAQATFIPERLWEERQ